MKHHDMTLVRRDLAPGGTLRAAINLGNAVLAQKNSGSDGLKGISVENARKLARRLEVELELIPFKSAGRSLKHLSRMSGQ